MKASVVACGLVACLLFGAARAEEPKAEPPKEAGSSKEKDSIAIGLMIGGNLKDNADDIDLDSVIKGLKEAFSDKQSMTPNEVQAAVGAFQQTIQKKQAEKMSKRGEEAKAKGEAYLADNKKKDGVKETPSGLQYKVVAEGTGDSPKATDTVTVKYTGTFIDGKVFDSTERHGGQPAKFPVNRVIPGWTEGLQLMKPGSKFQFTIPSKLAYGEAPPPQTDIPPNSVLLFDVELIKVDSGAGTGNIMDPGK